MQKLKKNSFMVYSLHHYKQTSELYFYLYSISAVFSILTRVVV